MRCKNAQVSKWRIVLQIKALFSSWVYGAETFFIIDITYLHKRINFLVVNKRQIKVLWSWKSVSKLIKNKCAQNDKKKRLCFIGYPTSLYDGIHLNFQLLVIYSNTQHLFYANIVWPHNVYFQTSNKWYFIQLFILILIISKELVTTFDKLKLKCF